MELMQLMQPLSNAPLISHSQLLLQYLLAVDMLLDDAPEQHRGCEGAAPPRRSAPNATAPRYSLAGRPRFL
jgi:hypothetical protein